MLVTAWHTSTSPRWVPNSAPAALQFQAPQAHNLTDIENSLARMQLQYSAMASQLASQKTDQKTSGAHGSAQGAPRLNQYPMV